MDLGDKDKFEVEKRNGDHLSYHSPSLSSDWRYGGTNVANTSMGLVHVGNPFTVCKGDLIGSSSCSSAPMVDSYCPPSWDHPTNSQALGLCDINVQTNASTSNTLSSSKGVSGSVRTGIDNMDWTPPSSMMKGGFFVPNVPGMLPPSLSQFPADSAFIERAARFSCFNGGNLGDMMNPFCIPESVNPYSRGGGMMQGPQEVFTGNVLESVSAGQSQKNELNMVDTSKVASLSVEHGAAEESVLKNERKSERSLEEANQGGVSGNESDEAEFSGGGGDQEEASVLEGTSGEPSARRIGSKKRKSSDQDAELNQAKGAKQQLHEPLKDNPEFQQKGDQNSSLAALKSAGKQSKHGSHASDPPKEEYIHVRARRGQATNSHSLAERVRREKISERMKFLQDLVPGCSKVTGKAVMLDEIINYVQSLQRQVEFLSMKLATVNPRLDFNIEGLLAKDILQSRTGPSSALGYSPDISMPYPQLHPSQPGLIQAGLPGMGPSSDGHRRTMNCQLTAMNGGYKEPTSQLPNVWEDELHNVVQMSLTTGAPPDSLDLDGSLPPGHMKVEL